MRLLPVLLLLANVAAAQERLLTGTIRTRLDDDVTIAILVEDRVVLRKRVPADGSFVIRTLLPGVYRVVTESKQHARLDRDVNLYHSRRDVTVTLEPGVTLRGRIVRKGVPPGKTVVHLGRRKMACKEDGSFTFTHCWPGKHKMRIHHNHGMVGEDETDIYRTREITLAGIETEKTLTLEPDQEVRFAAELPEGADEMEGRIDIAGRVEPFLFHVHRGKQGESRIFRGNRGKFYDYNARRKAAFVRIPGLGKGTHALFIRPRGGKELKRTVIVKGPTDVRVALEALRGRDIMTDAPAGAFVVVPGGLSSENPRGFLREGKRTVTFVSDRFLPSTLTLDVTHGKEPLELKFEMKRAPFVEGVIEGVKQATEVFVYPEGHPAFAISGRLDLSRMKRAKVKDGRFVVGGLPPGRYDVWLTDIKIHTFELGTESITLALRLPR